MNTKLILKNLNLLFVDDNHHINTEIESIFSPMFKNITLAKNSNEALAFFKQKPIDIVITDIEMPGDNGFLLIEAIRKSDPEIPIIILSAHSSKQHLMRAVNLCIDGYITKPLSFKKFDTVLDRAAKRLEHKVSSYKLNEQVVYHPMQKMLYVDYQEVSLGQKECMLLELLINNNHRIVGKLEIAKTIWGNSDMTESALKNLISELRRKLKYNLIKNQPSRGWILITQNFENFSSEA
jgi:two-component system, OmpR family, response regulator VanR